MQQSKFSLTNCWFLFQNFLLLEELEQYLSEEQTNLRPKEGQSWIELDNVTAKWDGVGSLSITILGDGDMLEVM